MPHKEKKINLLWNKEDIQESSDLMLYGHTSHLIKNEIFLIGGYNPTKIMNEMVIFSVKQKNIRI